LKGWSANRANESVVRSLFQLTALRVSVHDPEEQSWILRAQAGDREAFARLVDRYWVRIYRWLLNLTRNSHAAEDLTQDAFVKTWNKLTTFQAGTHFRAWLFRLAMNCFLDSRRGPRGNQPETLPAAVASREPDPVATLLTQETQTLVQMALDKLPVQFRAPILLRMQEDLSFQEIARVLDLTEETARWRVFKARKMLLKELGPTLDRDKP
jgi:RNA polymerase sigma-70 factor (ECF subfamily)